MEFPFQYHFSLVSELIDLLNVCNVVEIFFCGFQNFYTYAVLKDIHEEFDL